MDEAEEGLGTKGMTQRKMGTAAEMGMGPGVPEYRGMEYAPGARNYSRLSTCQSLTGCKKR